MDKDEAGKVILAELRLAKQRVVGELDEKEIVRERIADLVARLRVPGRPGTVPPTAADLAEVFGEACDVEDAGLRRALLAWGQEDAPAPQDQGGPLLARPQDGPPEPGTQG